MRKKRLRRAVGFSDAGTAARREWFAGIAPSVLVQGWAYLVRHVFHKPCVSLEVTMAVMRCYGFQMGCNVGVGMVEFTLYLAVSSKP